MLDVMLLLGKYAQHRAYVIESGELIIIGCQQPLCTLPLYRIKWHGVLTTLLGADILNVITQSALVKFLEASMDQIEVLANARVEQLPISTPKEVFSVTTQDTFWDAFKLMKKHVR
jgi:hypothetical protein